MPVFGRGETMKKAVLILSLLFQFAVGFAEYKKIEMNPPKAKEIQSRRLDRQTPLMLHKFKGYVGETDEGLIAVREIKKLPKIEQDTITKMVADENKDRQAWYKEIIAHNKLSEKEKGFLIKSAFDSFKGMDAKGTYFYENKRWQKKY